jgi:hypothetical protein
MPLLLNAFPNIQPVQRDNMDYIILSTSTMKEISTSMSSHFNGEITNVEAVGPGDGYHITFRSSDDQAAAERNGLTLPGAPNQAIGLLAIDDPGTRIPPSAPPAPPTAPITTALPVPTLIAV